MKKRLVTLFTILTTCICLIGCGKGAQEVVEEKDNIASEEASEDSEKEVAENSVEINDLIEANSPDNVFTNHTSLIISSTSNEDIVEQLAPMVNYIDAFTCYREKGLNLYHHHYVDGEPAGMIEEDDLLTEDGWVWHLKDSDSEKDFVEWYAMNQEEKAAFLNNPYYTQILNISEDSGEEFISRVQSDDGTVVLVSHTPIEVVYEEEFIPDEWKGATIECTYIFDGETLEYKSFTQDLIGADNSRINMINETIEYDVARPENFDALNQLHEDSLVEYKSGAENTRTITYIYDYGTDKEETFSITAPFSYMVKPVLREGYTPYTDPEGKEPFKGTEGKIDVTCYVYKE